MISSLVLSLSGFSATLWVIVAATTTVFLLLCLADRDCWRLAPVLLPYLLLLAAMATVWMHAPARPVPGPIPAAWIELHAAVSVATYALLTVAAAASLAAFMQERALKAKKPTGLSRLLPSVADSEALMVRLLAFSEGILALGLATGMATQYRTDGRLLVFDHKIFFSILAFLVIAGLLVVHRTTGLKGRLAIRLALVAYLLLTLAYPGVKFVTDVLLG